MYRYLVHVLRDNIISWRMIDDASGRAFSVFNSEQVEIDARIDRTRDVSKMETWYAKSMADAEALARQVAVHCPGAQVYIAEVKSVAVSQASPAVFSNVTEKGVVPR